MGSDAGCGTHAALSRKLALLRNDPSRDAWGLLVSPSHDGRTRRKDVKSLLTSSCVLDTVALTFLSLHDLSLVEPRMPSFKSNLEGVPWYTKHPCGARKNPTKGRWADGQSPQTRCEQYISSFAQWQS